LVLADGAGSAEFSRLGSSIAVATVCESLGASLARGLAPEAALIAAAEASLKALTTIAERQGIAFKSLYTTLLVAMMRGRDAYTLHIGDGLIAASDTEGGWQVLSRGDEGEFSNQTHFIDVNTVAAVHSRVQHHALAPTATLWAMTDGVSDAFLADAHQPQAFLQQFGVVQSAEQLLAALDFWQPGCHDDATLALVRPR
jgi:serine/threonine protein phosphatase PrpC